MSSDNIIWLAFNVFYYVLRYVRVLDVATFNVHSMVDFVFYGPIIRSQWLIFMAESYADAITTSFVNALQFEDWLVAKQQALAARFPCSPIFNLSLLLKVSLLYPVARFNFIHL